MINNRNYNKQFHGIFYVWLSKITFYIHGYFLLYFKVRTDYLTAHTGGNNFGDF